ncbi:MAG: pyridoxal phosphate-dependent aminotransferase [Planctomycetota bacterium]
MRGLASRTRGFERTLIRKMYDEAPKQAIDLGIGQPDLDPPQALQRAAEEAAHAGGAYSTNPGLIELREAIARRYPFRSGADEIVVTVGSAEAISLAFFALVEPGTKVLVPDPGYPAYANLARLLGAEPASYPLRANYQYSLQADDILDRLDEEVSLVIFNSPGNPTGGVHAEEQLARVVSELKWQGIPFVSDEVYEAYCYSPAKHFSPASLAPELGITVTSLSKSHNLMGWRIGWLAAPAPWIPSLVALHQHVVTCAPTLAQRVAIAALAGAGADEIERNLERFAKRRTLALERLADIPQLECVWAEGAFYCFVNVPGCESSLELARFLMRETGVITIPGIGFGSRGEGCLRVSYAVDEQTLERGLEALARGLEKAPGLSVPS